MAVYRDVLVVAPDAGLPNVEAEVRALSDALHPVSLRNGVTVRDVTERITRQSWDVIWFACHGTTEGVQLTDGILDTATLVSLVRTSGAKLVVLNTCESDMVGIYLWALTGAAVVATLSAIPDKAAYVAGALLADGLRRGLSIDDAFNRSKPGDMGQATRYRLWDGDEPERTENADAIAAATVRAMAAVQQPLAVRVEALDASVQSLSVMIANRRAVTRDMRTAYIAGIVLLLSPFLIADALYAQHVLFPWWIYLTVAFSLMSMGIWLLMRGNGMLS